MRLSSVLVLGGLLLGALGGLQLYWALVSYSSLSFNPPLFNYCDLTYPSCSRHYGPNPTWVAAFVVTGAIAGAGLGTIASRLKH